MFKSPSDFYRWIITEVVFFHFVWCFGMWSSSFLERVDSLFFFSLLSKGEKFHKNFACSRNCISMIGLFFMDNHVTNPDWWCLIAPCHYQLQNEVSRFVVFPSLTGAWDVLPPLKIYVLQSYVLAYVLLYCVSLYSFFFMICFYCGWLLSLWLQWTCYNCK